MSFHVEVTTTSGRGLSPEEIAHSAANKIVSVADTASPVIRDQAVAYKQRIEVVVRAAVEQGIRSDRTTVYNALRNAGHPQLAELIRGL